MSSRTQRIPAPTPMPLTEQLRHRLLADQAARTTTRPLPADLASPHPGIPDEGPQLVTAPATGPAGDGGTITVRVTADVEVWRGLGPGEIRRQTAAALDEFLGHVDGGMDAVKVELR